MERRIDLHVHTKASDGIFTPVEIIDHAVKNNISTLAITDHDTVSGLQEAMEYAKKISFDLIPGVEFGIEYPAGSLHIVGLFIDHTNNALIEITEWLKGSRIDRMKKIVDSLNAHGLDIGFNEVETESDGAAMGKSHIARIMVRKGYAPDLKYVFNNFMCRGKPGYVRRSRIPLKEAVSAIKNAGGTALIAHPVSLNFKSFSEFENLLEGFMESGIEGIEVYASMHTADDVPEFLKIANKRGLVISGGSDFHGDKGEKIGIYADNNTIPVHILDDIRRYRNKS